MNENTDTEKFNYKQYAVSARFLKEVDRFPGEEKPTMSHNQFIVTVKNTETGVRRGFTFTGSNRDWKIGNTHMETDDLKDALRSLLEDSGVAGLSFSEFCSEYGYEEDSRKAYRVYTACKKQFEKVNALGLDPVEDYNALTD